MFPVAFWKNKHYRMTENNQMDSALHYEPGGNQRLKQMRNYWYENGEAITDIRKNEKEAPLWSQQRACQVPRAIPYYIRMSNIRLWCFALKETRSKSIDGQMRPAVRPGRAVDPASHESASNIHRSPALPFAREPSRFVYKRYKR